MPSETPETPAARARETDEEFARRHWNANAPKILPFDGMTLNEQDAIRRAISAAYEEGDGAGWLRGMREAAEIASFMQHADEAEETEAAILRHIKGAAPPPAPQEPSVEPKPCDGPRAGKCSDLSASDNGSQFYCLRPIGCDGQPHRWHDPVNTINPMRPREWRTGEIATAIGDWSPSGLPASQPKPCEDRSVETCPIADCHDDGQHVHPGVKRGRVFQPRPVSPPAAGEGPMKRAARTVAVIDGRADVLHRLLVNASPDAASISCNLANCNGSCGICKPKSPTCDGSGAVHDADSAVTVPLNGCVRCRPCNDGEGCERCRKPEGVAKAAISCAGLLLSSVPRRHGHPCDHSIGVCEDASPDCESCSSECDDCDGSGTYTVDGEARDCICRGNEAPSPAPPPDAPRGETDERLMSELRYALDCIEWMARGKDFDRGGVNYDAWVKHERPRLEATLRLLRGLEGCCPSKPQPQPSSGRYTLWHGGDGEPSYINHDGEMVLNLADNSRINRENAQSVVDALNRETQPETPSAALAELRDSVLHERGVLAESGLSNFQLNAVLSLIDDALDKSAPQPETMAGEGRSEIDAAMIAELRESYLGACSEVETLRAALARSYRRRQKSQAEAATLRREGERLVAILADKAEHISIAMKALCAIRDGAAFPRQSAIDALGEMLNRAALSPSLSEGTTP